MRQRIIDYRLLHSIRDTAERFQVSPTTVQNLVKLYGETSDIAPRKRKAAPERLISPAGELHLQALLAEAPDLTLAELCEKYEAIYGVRVSVSTMHYTCKRMGYSYKKKHSTTRSGAKTAGQTKKQATSAS